MPGNLLALARHRLDDRPMLRRLLPVLVCAVATAAACAGGEWLWRRLVAARYLRDRETFAEPLLALCDGPELYRVKPGLSFEHRIPRPGGGAPTVVTYHTDALGHRARGASAAPPANAAAVWFVGDSYTFGQGVADGEAFPFVAESLLRASPTPIAAVDLGVPGHDAEQIRDVLAADLAAANPPPRLVVYGFVVNDAEPPTYAPPPPAARYGDAWSWLLEDGKTLGNRLGAWCIDDRPLFTPLRPAYDFDYRVSWAPGAPKGRAALAAITSMHERCRASGVRFAIAVLPDFTRAFDATYPFGPIHAAVTALGRERNVPTLDLLDGLRGSDAGSLRVPGDGHPDANGHRRLAEPLAMHLPEWLRG